MIGAFMAFGSPAPSLLVGAALFLAGAVLFGIARFMPRAAEHTAASDAGPAAAVSVRPRPLAPERAVGWPKLIEPSAEALDVDARRRVIEGLAVVGESWCAEILAQAYLDESDTLREAAIDAIGRCSGIVEPTLERALGSDRVVERYAAVDAASRRGDLALLERGLGDADGTVALAAAYGLLRAGRPELIDAGLAGRADARANEIRRILPVLT